MAQVLNIETDSIAQPTEVMTTSDNRVFAATYSPFSTAAGATKILPYGIKTGLVASGTATNDEVSVTAGTVSMADNGSADANGDLAVTSATVTVTRPASGQKRIEAITINAAGAVVVVNGADAADFSATYGDNGGPPLIPATSVLVAHVALESDVAAPITAGQIRQTPQGSATQAASREIVSFPTFTRQNDVGTATFSSALPATHTGDTSKRVIVTGSTPSFQRLGFVANYIPSEITAAGGASTPTFDGAITTTSTSNDASTFDIAQMEDGARDTIVRLAGTNVWTQYYPDDSDPDTYILTNGLLTIARDFQPDQAPTVSVTHTASTASTTIVDGAKVSQ